MEAACNGDVFKPTNLADDPIMLNIDSTAVVRNVAIFQHFLLNWKIWERAKQGVLEMLLATIEILVHGSHSYYTFNIIQFQKAKLVQQILIGCQVRLFRSAEKNSCLKLKASFVLNYSAVRRMIRFDNSRVLYSFWGRQFTDCLHSVGGGFR